MRAILSARVNDAGHLLTIRLSTVCKAISRDNKAPDLSASVDGPLDHVLYKCVGSMKKVLMSRPFAGPQQVLDYVGRYMHRVAISNNRLLDIEKRSGPLPVEGLSGRRRCRERGTSLRSRCSL